MKIGLIVLSILTVLVSTCLLIGLITPSGVRLSPDSRWYVSAGMQLSKGNGLTIPFYDASEDARILRPLINYPPILSLIYGGLISFGISCESSTILLSITAWFIFLISTALLIYRLSASLSAIFIGILLSSVSYSFILVFEHAWSEIIFIPLLVLLMAVLVDLPDKSKDNKRTIVITAFILTLILLTRYEGVFIYGTVIIWWFYQRMKRKQHNYLVFDLLTLAIPGIFLMVWLGRNTFLIGKPFGDQTNLSGYTILRSINNLGVEVISAIIPSVRPDQVLHAFGWMGLIIYPSIVIAAIYFAVVYRGKIVRSIHYEVERTPIIPIIGVYTTVHTFGPLVSAVWPMDFRFASPMLSIAYPWLIHFFLLQSSKRGKQFLYAFLAINIALAVWIPLKTGIFEYLNEEHITIQDTRVNFEQVKTLFQKGMLETLIVIPPRTKDLSKHFAELKSQLLKYHGEVNILSNEYLMFFSTNLGYVGSLDEWLDNGTCHPYKDIFIALFKYSDTEQNIDQKTTAIESKCTNSKKIESDTTITYIISK